MISNTLSKTRRKMQWSGLGAVIVTVALAGCGSKPEETASTTTAPPADTSAPATTATTAPPVTVTSGAKADSFKEAAAIWKQIQVANAALDKVIKSKNLKTVHEAAFKVRDIVKTLPAKSQALPADKQKTLASQVKNVAQIAGMLDESGDAKNQKATEENQAGLNDALDIIKGLYPPGALGS